MERDIDLLHFGMGKCMSTSLQAMWRESNQVQFVPTREMSWGINRTLVDCVQNNKPIPPIRLPIARQREDVPVIVSNEEFTFSFTTAPNLAAFLPLKQKYIAAQLHPRAKRLLLIVRSPVAWIKSAHAERINKGGVETLDEYMTDLAPLVLSMTNLKQILSYWDGAWDRLTVVPMEMFVQQPQQFWDLYVNELGMPMPADLSRMEARNKTNKASVEVAASLNKLLVYLTHLATQYGSEPNYNNLISNDKIVAAIENVRYNGTYLALNQASSEEIAAIQEFIGFEPDPQFAQARLPEAMREHLLANFVEPLARWPHMAGWIDAYRAEVESA